ncbi:prepilin-type N-terminal cleavage/methylation domain-containing protein [Thioalkalicoccus limnaeus]|uniref:Prepilin-type N-terminal cleavage/methylation domain-containing protein n=1 Tax=Thioalkalicoccus limnaeus TaxID=120681 RepID=A0ABV4BEV1_9GAMM
MKRVGFGQWVDSRQAGFSLLEVLVAFAILALSLGVLLQIFSQALRVTAAGVDYGRAATLAESRLQAVGFEIPLELGYHRGEDDDGLTWSVAIEPFALEAEFPGEPLAIPYLVRIEVVWPDAGRSERQLTLTSLRLGALP